MIQPKMLPTNLSLLRHAHSGLALPSEKDFDRRLDKNGVQQANKIARLAASHGYKPQQILCSTATRCRQTAEIFILNNGLDYEITTLQSLYNSSVETYINELLEQSTADNVMLIGHNPTLEILLLQLVG